MESLMQYTTEAELYAAIDKKRQEWANQFEIVQTDKGFRCQHKETGLSPQAMDIEAEIRLMRSS